MGKKHKRNILMIFLEEDDIIRRRKDEKKIVRIKLKIIKRRSINHHAISGTIKYQWFG